MEELIKVVESKTGLSHEQAKSATTAVLDYLKSKLPAPVSGQIDTLLKGGGGLADKAKNLGGLMGKN